MFYQYIAEVKTEPKVYQVYMVAQDQDDAFRATHNVIKKIGEVEASFYGPEQPKPDFTISI